MSINGIYQAKIAQVSQQLTEKINMVQTLKQDFQNVFLDAQNQANATDSSTAAAADSNTQVDASSNAQALSNYFLNGSNGQNLDAILAEIKSLSGVDSQTTTAINAYLQNAGSTGSANYDDLISAASAKYGVDANLIKGIIRAESNFNPQAVSEAGAVGLMQLMPATATALGVSDATNPGQNINGGVKYFAELLARFNGDVSLALAAYNYGPSRVEKLNIADGTDAEAMSQLPSSVNQYIENVLKYAANY